MNFVIAFDVCVCGVCTILSQNPVIDPNWQQICLGWAVMFGLWTIVAAIDNSKSK